MRIIPVIILCFMLTFTVVSLAGNIPTPPILRDEPVLEQQYLTYIYNNWNNLEVISEAPNTNRRGRVGDMILYNNSGTLELWVNSDGSTTWQQI